MNNSSIQTMSLPASTAVHYHNEELYPPALDWFIKSLMIVVTVLGLTGNSLVCYFFAKKKIERTSFNILLLNLSIADLLQDLLFYPVIFVDLKMLRGCSQSTANLLCSFTGHPAHVGALASISILTITYISLNRFVAVIFPLKVAWFKSIKVTSATLLVIWIVSLGYFVPAFFSMRYDARYAICHREWPKIINVTLWSTANMVFGNIVPVAVMLLTYFCTLRKFKSMTEASPLRDSVDMKKKRAVRLLGFLIFAFLICFVPITVFVLLAIRVQSIWPQGAEGNYLRMRIKRCLFVLYLTNTLADPLLYGYCNYEFQRCFKEVFNDLKTFLGLEKSISTPDCAGQCWKLNSKRKSKS